MLSWLADCDVAEHSLHQKMCHEENRIPVLGRKRGRNFPARDKAGASAGRPEP